MSYLYAGLGMVMFTSIMIIIDVANSFLQQETSSIASRDSYFGSALQAKDITFLKLASLFDSDLDCLLLENEIKGNPLFSGLSSYSVGVSSPSLHSTFINSCVFSSQGHRVVIAPNSTLSANPRVYSCVLVNDVTCNFELNTYDDK